MTVVFIFDTTHEDLDFDNSCRDTPLDRGYPQNPSSLTAPLSGVALALSGTPVASEGRLIAFMASVIFIRMASQRLSFTQKFSPRCLP